MTSSVSVSGLFQVITCIITGDEDQNGLEPISHLAPVNSFLSPIFELYC